ncbi:MAG: hypothetical protein ACLU9X_03365 [Alistipes shahii]
MIQVDSTALRELDSLIGLQRPSKQDSLLSTCWPIRWRRLGGDALPADSVDSLTGCRATRIYRLMKGYRDVRIFRSDFQAVCDSMTAISTDSTIHLYINPVLWNQGNQITPT